MLPGGSWEIMSGIDQCDGSHTQALTHTCASSSSMRASLPPLSYWGDILQLMRTHKHRRLYRPARLNKVLHIWTRKKTISMKAPRSTAAPPPESVVKDTISQTHAGSPSLSPTAASRHSWAVVVFKWMPHTIHRYRVRDPVGCGALSKGFTSFQQQNMVSSLVVQARVGRKSQA